MAAGLAQPALIERWLDNPEDLRIALAAEVSDTQVVDVELFLTRLRQLAGLITKVRHNPVRAALPLTFRALDASGLESDLFAAYAARFTASVRDGERTRATRQAAFVEFALEWLDAANPLHSLVRDVICHELTVATLLGKDDETRVSPPGVTAELAPATTPELRGDQVIVEMSSLPDEVSGRLALEARDLSEITRGQFTFVYWRPPEERSVRVIEIDPFATFLLDTINGEVSVRGITDGLIGQGVAVTVDVVLSALARLAERGLVQCRTS
jgi:hypothetical protein